MRLRPDGNVTDVRGVFRKAPLSILITVEGIDICSKVLLSKANSRISRIPCGIITDLMYWLPKKTDLPIASTRWVSLVDLSMVFCGTTKLPEAVGASTRQQVILIIFWVVVS